MACEKFLGALLLFSVAGLRLSVEGSAFNGTLDCVNNTDDREYILCVGRPGAVEVGQNTSFQMVVVKKFGGMAAGNATLNVTLYHPWLALVDPGIVRISDGSVVTISLQSLEAGRSEIGFNCTSNTTKDCPFTKEYLKLVKRQVGFARSHALDIIIIIVGWIYFVAWSISFYPQIVLNFYRRSVIGLNFDFLALNITGFLSYAVFNIGLFWIQTIQTEYFKRNPAGINPVLLNDVVFSLHAVVATFFTIFQCFILKRGGQRVSYTAMVILVMCWLVLFISLFVSVGKKLEWLDFLYVASYVKLVITLLKYIPQAWYNFKRRSTVGWSIGNVLLDSIGGTFSILQMLLLSYNYDDWKSIFGDPTKFGLGLFSILFDLFFMFQHYVLFRHPREPDGGYKKIETSSNQDEDETMTPPPKVNDGDKVSASLSDEERPLLAGRSKKKSKLKMMMDFCKITT